jgi:hypothetical protein
VPQTVLRVALAAILLVVAGKIGSEELKLSTTPVLASSHSTGR